MKGYKLQSPPEYSLAHRPKTTIIEVVEATKQG